MLIHYPRLVIGALKGGSGKTLISIGLASLLKEKGYNVAVFKKGPDFIDPDWLSLAAGNRCYNLDPFLMDKAQIMSSFISNTLNKDIAIIEGNRGIYDGMDPKGRYSTAELAKLLASPLLLILDVTMSTRTVAAVLKGCQIFDRNLDIKGVILNRVARARQEKLIRECIDLYCKIPVVGAIPKIKENLLKERHMGLVPSQEREQAKKVIEWAKEIVKSYVDIEKVIKIAKEVPPLKAEFKNERLELKKEVRIGVFYDRAFWFYYPENLDILKDMGAELIKINAIEDKDIPAVDAIYIGGGFPETQAEFLAKNESLKKRLKELIEDGLPVYAECGGLMYLGKSLILDEKEYPMVDFFPVKFFMEKRPQGHGYTILEVCKPNPFFSVKEIIKGHEFHYSRPYILNNEKVHFAFKVIKGKGIIQQQDGICRKNVLATYTHIHARGNRKWPEAIIEMGKNFRKKHCFSG